MAFTFQTNPATAHTYCDVCGAQIQPQPGHNPHAVQQAQGLSVCDNFECKRLEQESHTMPAHLFQSHLAFHKDLMQKRKAKEAERAAFVAAIDEKEAQENKQILADVLAAQPELAQQALPVLPLPQGESDFIDTSAERIEAYKTHLRTVIDQAFSDNPKDYTDHEDRISKEKRDASETLLDANPALQALSDACCTVCKGGCCAHGAEKAYIKVATIMRMQTDMPDMSADDFYELYTSHISPKAMKNSCINHTNTGCALPRDLRSDTCNGYFCNTVRNFQQRHHEDLPETVLAVQRSHTNWNRLDQTKTHKLVGAALIAQTEATQTQTRYIPLKQLD